MINATEDLALEGAGATAVTTTRPAAPARAWPEAIDDEAQPESRTRSRSVLVALHGRRAQHARAIEMARLIARALGAPLHGLFIGPAPIDASEVPERVGLTAEALRGVALEVVVSHDPARALIEVAERCGAAFVVVAAELDELLDERLGIGELGTHALLDAACGVILMGPTGAAPRLQRILLPLDGTPSTAAAITPVGELARSLDAKLDIVMVGYGSQRAPRAPRARGDDRDAPPEPALAPLEAGAMIPPRYVDQPQHEWAAFTEEFLDRFLNAIGHFPPDVATRLFLGAGEPAAEILRIAGERKSDLIALVWHGHLEEHHGAVFCDVLRRAPCPVLVLRR